MFICGIDFYQFISVRPKCLNVCLHHFLLLSPSKGATVKYCDQPSVCMSVCLSANMSQKLQVQISLNFLFFSTCYWWLWLGPSLTARQYVMYF